MVTVRHEPFAGGRRKMAPLAPAAGHGNRYPIRYIFRINQLIALGHVASIGRRSCRENIRQAIGGSKKYGQAYEQIVPPLKASEFSDLDQDVVKVQDGGRRTCRWS